MSIHNSLSINSAGVKHRCVLKRHEKMEALKSKGLWDETKGALGLQKVKILKIKAKKEKAKTEGEGEAAGATGTADATGAAVTAVPAADKKVGSDKKK